ncbi:type II toxin-antitoxin system RelE/ParE family toxin [Arcobacter sp. FWKO B]|nr:type II toxin-antitoxin system RelE/ParE family toxin [Arcobacter sp. FWKO B]
MIALEEVSFDLKIAEDFYEKQNFGLGGYFRDSLISDIESLWLYGGIHSKVFGLYRLLSKRFPYGIYYDLKDDVIIIIAILDLRQDPKNIEKFLAYREVN